jgi:ATP-binding cassette subfamily B protein
MLRRFAFIRQNDQSDCGAAALATVAMHYRIPIGLQQMRELAGTDRVGTNLLGLIEAAERIGFSAKGVKGPYESLARVPLPAIAHWKTEDGLGHFVVLHRVNDDSVVVADPARWVERMPRDDFSQRWTGYLLLIVPDSQASPAPRKVKPSIGPVRRFLGLLQGHKPVLVEAFFCALIMTLLGVSTSYFVQHLVDHVLVRGETALLNALGIGMVLIVAFRTVFGLLRQYLLAHVGRKVDLSLIASYTRHVLHLPLRFFETRQVGEILSRVNDAAKVREAVSGITMTAMVDATLVAMMAAILWVYDVPLAIAATSAVPLMILSTALHHPASRRQSHEAMESAAKLSAQLVEDVTGIDTIKAFGAERARAEDGEDRLVGFIQSVFALEKLGLSMHALGTLVTGLSGVLILWYGGHRVVTGALTIGQLMFFYSLLTYMLEPLDRLASVNLKIQEALVAMDRLHQVMDLDPEPLGLPDRVNFTAIHQAIELRSVSFRYACRSGVLDQIDLRIPAGKTVAIVGESGSGKSTLLKLLTGFYAPTEGRLLIDGLDMAQYDLASLRAGIGLVAQEPFVFNGTVLENIAVGRPGASLAEIIDAANAAGLDEFIASLPERFETVIGERGANLSGGQRQRLAIARALLRRPEILIFDEATSHLDTATERAIQVSLRSALAGRTVVLVAHRLSTIRDADLIYVLHRGRVAESGTHRELLAMNGRYTDLCRSQFGDRDHVSGSASWSEPSSN